MPRIEKRHHWWEVTEEEEEEKKKKAEAEKGGTKATETAPRTETPAPDLSRKGPAEAPTKTPRAPQIDEQPTKAERRPRGR